MLNEDIKILIVDDEPNSTILLRKVLEKKGLNPVTENNSTKAGLDSAGSPE